MQIRILATALLFGLAPQFASATHDHGKKKPEEDPGQLRCHLDRCSQERDAARNEAKALTESLAQSNRELQARKENESKLSHDLAALKSALESAAGKRRELEQSLAQALQNRGEHENEIRELTESLRKHSEQQKQDADALAKARYGIEQAKNELNAAVQARQVLEAQLAEANNRATEAEKLVASLQQTIREKDELQKRTENDLNLARSNFEKAQNELRAAAETKKQLETSLATAQSKSADADNRLRQLGESSSATNSQLQKAQADLATSQQNLATTRAKSAELEQKFIESAQRRKELEDALAKANANSDSATLAAAQDEVTRLRSVLEKSGPAHRALEAELAACRNQQTAILEENEKLKNQVGQLTESHEKTNSDLASTGAELTVTRAEIAKLNEQLNSHRELETRYRDLAGRHESVVKDLHSRKEALAAADQNIRQLEEKRDHDTDLISRLTRELNTAHEATQSSDQAHAALNDELAKIKEILARAGEIGTAHRELQKRHETLQAEYNAAKIELEKNREAHRCCEEKLKAALAESDDLRSQIERAKSALQESESLRVESERKLAECLGNGEQSRKSIAEIHARLQESEGQRHRLNEENGRLREALAALENAGGKASHEIGELQKRLAEGQSQLAESDKLRVAIEAELANRTREATAALESAKALRAEIAQRDAVIAKLQSENDQLRQLFANSQKQSAETKAQLEAELARTAAQIKSASDALAASEHKRKETESALLAANQEIARLKSELAKQGESQAATITKLTTELTDVTKLLEICTSKHAALEVKIAESEKSRTDLANANRALAAQLEDALKAKPDENILQDLAKTRERLAAEEKARKGAEHTISELRTQMASVQKEADAFREQLVRIEPVYYSINRADIEQQQARVLAQVREVLEFYPAATFHLAGHTCNIGSPDSNLALSKQRAEGLAAFLQHNRVPGDKITSEGVGESNPAADNSSEIGRRLNRHTAIQVNLHID